MEDRRSDEEACKHQGKDDNTFVVNRIVGHIGSGPRLRYVVQTYGYGKADDTTEPPSI